MKPGCSEGLRPTVARVSAEARYEEHDVITKSAGDWNTIQTCFEGLPFLVNALNVKSLFFLFVQVELLLCCILTGNLADRVHRSLCFAILL